MSNFENTYDLIDAYLNGCLNDEDCSLVEQRLKEDNNFRNYFEQHKLANDLIKEGEFRALKKQLETIHKNHRLKVFSFKILLGVIAFVVFFSSIYFYNNKEQSRPLKHNGKTAIEESIKKCAKKEIVVKNVFFTNNNNSGNKSELKKENTNEDKLIDTRIIPIKNEDSLALTDKLKAKTDSNLILLKDSIASSNKGRLIDETEVAPSLDNQKQIVSNDCENDFWVAFDIEEIIPTVKGEHNGSFKFIALEDTYAYSIDDGKNQTTKTFFSGLASKTYNLIAIDSQGCKSLAQEIFIPELESDFVIYPRQSRYWNIPLSIFRDKTEVNLKIYDAKSGQLVYDAVLGGFDENVWQGVGKDNQSLPMGNYVYVLKSPRKSIKGNITIVE